MERINVVSSNIKSIGYDESSTILEIEFLNSRLYQYFNVPIEIYDELMNADSQGKYFNANIKNIFDWNEVWNWKRYTLILKTVLELEI